MQWAPGHPANCTIEGFELTAASFPSLGFFYTALPGSQKSLSLMPLFTSEEAEAWKY